MHRTREGARAEVRRLLNSMQPQPDGEAADLEPLLDSFIEEHGGPGWGDASPPGAAAQWTVVVPGIRKDHYFAIRNEDLDLVSTLMPAGGSIGAALWLGTGLPSAIVGAAVTTVLMGRKVSRNGVRLTEDQYRLLMALKVAGPCTEDRLASVCARLEGRTDGDWARSRIDALLTGLQGMTTPAGSVINLVSRDGQGLWHRNA